MRLVSVGEILWDLVGGVERLGGAPLNFAAHAVRLGDEALVVSAVGEDERGRRALLAMEELRLSSAFVHSTSHAPTGVVNVIVDEAGQPSYTVVRRAAYDFAELSDGELVAIARQAPDALVFGTLAQQAPSVRALTEQLIRRCAPALRLYDVNLRSGCYTPELVLELLALASVVKLNTEEAGKIRRILGIPRMSRLGFCSRLSSLFGLRAVALTRGAHGCSLLVEGAYAEVEAVASHVVDAVGAGDAFGAAFLHGIHHGWPVHDVGRVANAVGALVASRPGGTPEWSIADLPAQRGTGGSVGPGRRQGGAAR